MHFENVRKLKFARFTIVKLYKCLPSYLRVLGVNMGKKAVRIRDEKDFEEKKRLEEERKKQKEKPKPAKKIAVARGIVRILETDMDGTKKLSAALLRIRGIGHGLASAVPQVAGMDGSALVGNLSEQQIEHLEEVIKNIYKHVPSHMVNRRRDITTGEDRHVVESELALARKTDIDFMKKIRSYKGVRHELGLPVRGQRTRSSFRTGMIVGVARKAAKEAAKKAEPAGAAPAAGAPGAVAPAAPGAKAAPGVAKAAQPAEKKEEKKEEKK